MVSKDDAPWLLLVLHFQNQHQFHLKPPVMTHDEAAQRGKGAEYKARVSHCAGAVNVDVNTMLLPGRIAERFQD